MPDELMVPFDNIKDQETAAVVNSAATNIANEAGEAALGAKGPEAAKAAQQGFSKDQWMRFAMFGLMISSGKQDDVRRAAETMIAAQLKDKAIASKEKNVESR